MTKLYCFLLLTLAACTSKENEKLGIEGTWKLLNGSLIEAGDTLVTDYTQNVSFIKIINGTHFSFIQHDLNGGKDSAAVFAAGAGSYNLKGNKYTEHLAYCSDRAWENHDFEFELSIEQDTLIQKGLEKIEDQGIERMNIEKYVRVR